MPEYQPGSQDFLTTLSSERLSVICQSEPSGQRQSPTTGVPDSEPACNQNRPVHSTRRMICSPESVETTLDLQVAADLLAARPKWLPPPAVSLPCLRLPTHLMSRPGPHHPPALQTSCSYKRLATAVRSSRRRHVPLRSAEPSQGAASAEACKGRDISPSASAKEASSKAFCIFPLPKRPRSPPPRNRSLDRNRLGPDLAYCTSLSH